jgi:hypothetical protein
MLQKEGTNDRTDLWNRKQCESTTFRRRTEWKITACLAEQCESTGFSDNTVKDHCKNMKRDYQNSTIADVECQNTARTCKNELKLLVLQGKRGTFMKVHRTRRGSTEETQNRLVEQH